MEGDPCDTLSYNLGNFMRTLAMTKPAEPWSLTSLQEKLIKIGARVASQPSTSCSNILGAQTAR